MIRHQGVWSLDIYSCQNIFYKQMTSFIRQIIIFSRDVGGTGIELVSLLPLTQSVSQSVNQCGTEICIKLNKQIIPISLIIADREGMLPAMATQTIIIFIAF